MITAKSNLSIFISFLTVLLLSACGGGGGGDDSTDSTTTTTTTTGVSITSTNAELIASKLVRTIASVQGTTSGTDFLSGVSIDIVAADASYADIITTLLRQQSILVSQSYTQMVTGIVVSETQTCSGGGTVTLSGDVSNVNIISVGDSLTFTFNNCVELGTVWNGTLDFTITELTGNVDLTPPYTLSVDAFMTSLSISDGSTVIIGDGDMSLQISEDLSGNETVMLSGNSYSESVNGQSEVLTNYLYSIDTNSISGDFSIGLSGTYESAAIGGSVSFDTLTLFTGNTLISENPLAGELLITSSFDNSQALVTAWADGINVEIRVDAYGYGIDSLYVEIILTTWTALDSL